MVKAKKHLGQHFLTDSNIAAKLAKAIPDLGIDVLEIGPGTGMLTKELLDLNHNVKVCEIDEESVDYLNENFEQLKDKVFFEDFLKTDLRKIVPEDFVLCGNFPYNISTQIMFRMLEFKDSIPFMAGMFQKEVAERIVAPHGNKQYGILSVLIQTWYEGKYLFTVHENVFKPAPKVKSAVISLKRKEDNPLTHKTPEYFKLVKTAFNQRRKTLRNALKPLGLELPEKYASKRAEQLSVADFIELHSELFPD